MIYTNLPEDEKMKVKCILYILDKFAVSLESYHEVQQFAQEELPKMYLVEECQKDLNSEWDVKRTPGQAPGAELPIGLLIKKEIKNHVSVVLQYNHDHNILNI